MDVTGKHLLVLLGPLRDKKKKTLTSLLNLQCAPSLLAAQACGPV